jgi:hypothetical protein
MSADLILALFLFTGFLSATMAARALMMAFHVVDVALRELLLRGFEP